MPKRAGDITGDLINGDKVDIVLGGRALPTRSIRRSPSARASGARCSPTGRNGTAFVANAPKEGYQVGLHLRLRRRRHLLQPHARFSSKLETNKVLGLVLANDIDGITASKWAPGVFEGGGYKVVATDLYTPGAEDFTQPALRP